MNKKMTIEFILVNFKYMGATNFQLKKEKILMNLFESRIQRNLSYFLPISHALYVRSRGA
jgi:hypothetical protein